ncbi:hypothetical protein KVP08_000725 [Shewanella putrefaciens]|nr:hypothetical protein KVP08_000725 [Shewanella putrefaciens]
MSTKTINLKKRGDFVFSFIFDGIIRLTDTGKKKHAYDRRRLTAES